MIHDRIKEQVREKHFYGIVAMIWIATMGSVRNDVEDIFHIIAGAFFLLVYVSCWREEKRLIALSNTGGIEKLSQKQPI